MSLTPEQKERLAAHAPFKLREDGVIEDCNGIGFWEAGRVASIDALMVEWLNEIVLDDRASRGAVGADPVLSRSEEEIYQKAAVAERTRVWLYGGHLLARETLTSEDFLHFLTDIVQGKHQRETL